MLRAGVMGAHALGAYRPRSVRHRTWSTRLARRIPAVMLEQPWALFVKGLCIVSGITTWIGPAPGSISAALPGPVVWLWSATLVCGAGAGLLGLLVERFRRVEIAGLVWLGTASLVYGATVLIRFRLDGTVAAGVLVALGCAALVRALALHVTYQIARRVTRPDVP